MCNSVVNAMIKKCCLVGVCFFGGGEVLYILHVVLVIKGKQMLQGNSTRYKVTKDNVQFCPGQW